MGDALAEEGAFPRLNRKRSTGVTGHLTSSSHTLHTSSWIKPERTSLAYGVYYYTQIDAQESS